ncbi:MAG TPA: DUF3397 family protein [Pseudogracilibacillus sp.]|nr:DUF3397 family protein [Pseudogracilibacillus sp.]
METRKENVMELFTFILIIVPVFSTILLYRLHKKIKKSSWKAFHFSSQVSSLFYIAAVTSLLYVLFEMNVIGKILILFLIILSIILILQWKQDTEVSFLKAMKLLLRISFLSFGLLYVLLIVYWGVDYFYLAA